MLIRSGPCQIWEHMFHASHGDATAVAVAKGESVASALADASAHLFVLEKNWKNWKKMEKKGT